MAYGMGSGRVRLGTRELASQRRPMTQAEARRARRKRAATRERVATAEAYAARVLAEDRARRDAAAWWGLRAWIGAWARNVWAGLRALAPSWCRCNAEFCKHHPEMGVE